MKNAGAVLSLAVAAAAYPSMGPYERVSRIFDRSVDLYADWPSYDQLPLNSSYPTKAAWGVWGADDQLGALNHITNDTILAASQTIQDGLAFPLNLRLDVPDPPSNAARKPLSHLYMPQDGYTDDVLVMNTQISTQFDGLRHYPYSTNNSVYTYQWYNDLIADYEDVIGPKPTEALGLQVSAEKGIAVRAVLFDFAGWMDATNQTFDPFTDFQINPGQLDEVADWQNMPEDWSQPGDMLIIRTGWVRQYNTLNITERALLRVQNWPYIGLEASDRTLRWLWEKKLSLIGADNPAVESSSFIAEIDGAMRNLHQVFIGGWGMSIVEFLYLEELVPAMHSRNRWNFFLTIQNLNVVSGIASPPNALAIL
ncbi:hypothetical protein F5B22DRAFT_195500 [Xylaria bambusicola]|uniref:uncharacterized protein n=1 Tax=Xylaria bambusicola TaxID=326684 RepID=UPI002008BB07|nr:uncharacterized protein F5B22DRAFT_195500 [Xylaria bambusicola]KAI0515278.1 hypothetical protein F5B22DRAFT_195500 [Xylaria bambusicola]